MKTSSFTPQQLSDRLRRGETPQLIDVRDAGEFAAGRIAGAMLLPLAELTARACNLDRNRPVVLICQSGRRSAQGQQTLHELGFENVAQLDGGIAAWQQAGLPLQRDTRAPWALERQVRLVAGALVLIGLSLAHAWPPAIVLSWFVGAGLVVAALTNSCMMGLLLAKLPWNQPTPTCCSSKP